MPWRGRRAAARCLIAAALLALAARPAAAATLAAFATDLKPVNSAAALAGVGSGRFTMELVDDPADTFFYNLTLVDVNLVTKAHIHYGAPGEAGPAMVVLAPQGANASDVLLPAPFVSGSVDLRGNFTPADFISVLTGSPASQMQQLTADNLIYITIHSVDYPNGALRGQLALTTAAAPVSAPALAPVPSSLLTPVPPEPAPAPTLSPAGAPPPASPSPATASPPAAGDWPPAAASPSPGMGPMASPPASAPASPSPSPGPGPGAAAPGPFGIQGDPNPPAQAPTPGPGEANEFPPGPAPGPDEGNEYGPAGAPSPAPDALPPEPADAQTLDADLTPPPGSSEGSTGKFHAFLLPDGKSFGWRLLLTNITGLTMVHIHNGDPSATGAAAALLVGLLPPGTGSKHIPYSPALSGNLSFEGVFGPADFNANLQGQDAQAFLQASQQGQLWVNVHTTSQPTSAIRGPLLPAGTPSPPPSGPPPLNTQLEANMTASAASNETGTGIFHLNPTADGSSFGWDIVLTDVHQITMVHIHQGNPAASGSSAALVIGLLPAGTGAKHIPFDTPPSGNLSYEGNFNASEFNGPFANLDGAAFLQAAREGQFWVNAHSVDNPTSAISGQLLLPGGPLVAAPPAPPAGQDISAVLAPSNGSNETATGNFTMTVQGGAGGRRLKQNADGTFSWRLQLKDIHNLTMVHIHQGDPAASGSAAPLIVGLLPPGSGASHAKYDPPLSGDQFFEGTFGPADFNGPFAGKSSADFLAAIKAGEMWMNVHTVENPTSAISGQMTPPGGLSAASPPSPAPATGSSGTSSSDSGGSSTSIGAIVGGVVGGIAAVAVGLALFLYWRKRRSTHDRLHAAPSSSAMGPTKSMGAPSEAGSQPFDSKSQQAPSSWEAANMKDTFVSHSSGHSGPFTAPIVPSTPGTNRHMSSRAVIEGDPLLVFIGSHLSNRSSGAPGSRGNLGSAGFGPRSSGPAGMSRASSTSQRTSVDVQHYLIKWEDLKMEGILGSGSFGRVFLAKYFQTPVAVKVLIDRENFETGSLTLPAHVMKSLEEEVRVMCRIRHPNVLALMGLCMVPACIVTEFCSLGSLYDVLRAAAKDPELAAQLTWRRRLGMAIDAATGMLHLHSRTPAIIHRDLKSPNLLVGKHYEVKVGDFNLSKILEEGQPGVANVSSLGGGNNPLWLAPEVLRGERATALSDVYSFGLIMWELLTWQLPWVGLPPFQIMQAVMSGQRPDVPPAESLPGAAEGLPGLDGYTLLMRECWADAEGDRPEFEEIVSRLQRLVAMLPGGAPSEASSYQPGSAR